MREQRITQQHADRIAPLGIDRRLFPAQIRAVHDVVMDQGGDVD